MPALPFVPPEYVGRRLLMLVSMWLGDAEDPEGAEMIGRLTEIGEPCIKASTHLTDRDGFLAPGAGLLRARSPGSAAGRFQG